MRLTKFQIDVILRRVMEETFDKRNLALIKTESELGMLAYNEAVIASIRNTAKKLPNGWLPATSHLDFNIGGQRHRLRVTKNVLTPYHSENNYLGVIGGELGERIIKLAADKKDYLTERDATYNKLRIMLSSVGTFAKLKTLWPEGLKFYKDLDEDGKIRGGLPAIRFDEINATLGLKTKG